MGNVTIYLPDAVAQQAREAEMNVSAVARAAVVAALNGEGEPGEKLDGALVGKWFHSYSPPTEPVTKYDHTDSHGNVRHWQGRVVGQVTADAFLCQLYSWMDGRANGLKVVPVTDMLLWNFFDTEADMICADGCPENSDRDREAPCGNPVTRVIRNSAIGDVYRCGSCIEFYAGSETAEAV